MDEFEQKIRGFVVAEALRRPSEIPIEYQDGRARPDGKALATSLVVSEATASRLLTGMSQRTPTERPRRPYEMSVPLRKALMKWTGFKNQSDLMREIEKADPMPPFPKQGTGGPRPANLRKPVKKAGRRGKSSNIHRIH